MVHQGTVGAQRGRGQEGSLLQQCAFHICRGTVHLMSPSAAALCIPPPLNHKPRRFFCDACLLRCMNRSASWQSAEGRRWNRSLTGSKTAPAAAILRGFNRQR